MTNGVPAQSADDGNFSLADEGSLQAEGEVQKIPQGAEVNSGLENYEQVIFSEREKTGAAVEAVLKNSQLAVGNDVFRGRTTYEQAAPANVGGGDFSQKRAEGHEAGEEKRRIPEQERRLEHHFNMFRVWEKLRKTPDMRRYGFLERRVLEKLQDKKFAGFFTVLMEVFDLQDKERQELLESLVKLEPGEAGEAISAMYLGKNEKTKQDCLSMRLNSDASRQISTIAKNCRRPYALFNGSSTAAFLYENNFKDLTEEDFQFLAGLMLLDIEASLIDSDTDERYTIDLLERFSQSKKNHDLVKALSREVEDVMKQPLSAAQKFQIKTQTGKGIEELRKKDIVEQGQIDELREQMMDFIHVPEDEIGLKKVLTEAEAFLEKRNAAAFMERYRHYQRLWDEAEDRKADKDKVRELMNQQLHLTDEQAEKACEILKRHARGIVFMVRKNVPEAQEVRRAA